MSTIAAPTALSVIRQQKLLEEVGYAGHQAAVSGSTWHVWRVPECQDDDIDVYVAMDYWPHSTEIRVVCSVYPMGSAKVHGGGV